MILAGGYFWCVSLEKSRAKFNSKKTVWFLLSVFPGTDLLNVHSLPTHTPGHQQLGWFSCMWLFPKTFHTKLASWLAFLVGGFTQNPRYHSEITNDKLVGGFNRFEAYESNWIISPLRVENKATI